MNSAPLKLNVKKTILVGLAFFLIMAFWQAYDTIVPKILTEKFGMAHWLSGVIMALDNILALFLLPFLEHFPTSANLKGANAPPSSSLAPFFPALPSWASFLPTACKAVALRQ